MIEAEKRIIIVEDALYQSHKVITLHDIQQCLSSAGYKTALYPDLSGRERLNVHYPATFEGKEVEDDCYWVEVSSSRHNDPYEDAFQAQLPVKRIQNPVSSFEIGIHPGTINGLIPMMRQIFTCFGGQVNVDWYLYEIENIDQLHWPEHNDFDEDE